MESNMTDPKTARDCLAHCLDVLTDEQLWTAVERIELYAGLRALNAVNECTAAVRRAFAGNLLAEPSKDAEPRLPSPACGTPPYRDG
jgi:hypothetical protein